MVYSRNTFVLLQNSMLVDLQDTLAPDRFTAIRSLHVHWQFPGDYVRRKIAHFIPCVVTPLHDLPSLETLSIFVQGPMCGSAEYWFSIDFLRPIKERVSKSFAVRVPWPTQQRRTDDRRQIKQYLESHEFGGQMVQTPWQDGVEMADEKTTFDGGWRVGTMFLPSDDGSAGPQRTTYAMRIPTSHVIPSTLQAERSPPRSLRQRRQGFRPRGRR
jgi:hypothetical protein